MGAKKLMRLIDNRTGRMECKVCGAQHWAMTRRGGGFFRGAWQCLNHCSPDDIPAIKRKQDLELAGKVDDGRN
jgi:hypothetical protein